MKEIVKRLCRKYDTHDPFELADCLGVILVKSPLTDNVRGFYRFIQRRKVIVVNSNLPWEEQRIVCAHELGHSVLHKDVNAVFLNMCTFLVTDRYELEANHFAADLMISDEDVELYKELSVQQLQIMFGFDEETIRYRFGGRKDL